MYLYIFVTILRVYVYIYWERVRIMTNMMCFDLNVKLIVVYVDL